MKNYYVGFDIGTNSIGWATTDEEYNLLRARGHDFWGTYLFDEANTAESRRMNRTARRHTARKRQRIKLLQELFAKEIAKVDFSFFVRLENSKYLIEDKDDGVKHKDNLFNDDAFKDKDYYKKYPTIYHLRRAFLSEDEAKRITDIRLLYLAVAHIIKNRGHFLFEGQTISVGDKQIAEDAFSHINEILYEIDEDIPSLDLKELDEALAVLGDKNRTKTDKERELKRLFAIGAGNKTGAMLVKSMVGGKVNVKNLFGDEEPAVKDFCFDDASFELEKLKEHFSEDEYALICEAKSVYDWAVLSQILGDYKFISEAMCAKYERHGEDLRMLKEYVYENFGKEKYKEVFYKSEKVANYAAYIGSNRGKSVARAKKEDFYKYLKTFVSSDTEIYRRIEDGTFLDKQRMSSNGVIPYQVHLAELETILKNASTNFPFLNEVADGYSVADKIVMLMTFRIPYYVGPLNTAHSNDGKGFAWVKKFNGTENVKITPWNFDSIVDRQASEDEFINRMTNKCTYLIGEDVLPKQSLLYSEFAFLNELNNVTFMGKRLDKRARDIIIDYAKENNKKITLTLIGKLLSANGLIEPAEAKKENFAGIDGEIKGSFATYRFFKRVFGDDFDADTCEDIVRCFTIMGDAKRATERMKRKYGFNDEIAKKLKDLNCSGWGKMSKAFLDGEDVCHVSKESGEIYTIIEAMRETGCNLMELLSAKYDFMSCVDAFNAQNSDSGKVTYGTIENLYCSPSVKRAIWRTVCLAREIEKVQGGPPKRIFIEMARGKEEDKKGVRTKSRKEQLLELYRSIGSDAADWVAQIENIDDAKFLNDRLYLYFIQYGRSAYSGKSINIEDVFNTNVCDIDHIYPQSKIKDDSILNNKVLCYKTENATKTDNYPLPYEIREKMTPIWSWWHSQKLINDEKYKRLTRRDALTEEELSSFINRQLVSTRQSTKAVAQVLKQMYPDCEIVYSKAKNVVDFKNKVNKDGVKLVKVREINDLHHAKDAYLNVVVGNVYYTKFNRDARVFYANRNGNSYNLNKLFDEPIKNAWDPSMTDKVVAIAKRNTPKVVRFTSSGHGSLFNATIKTKGANDKLIPLKRNGILEQTDKYGGYDSATTAHFALVRSLDKKGKILITLEAIPIYITLLNDENATYDYLVNNAGLNSPEVVIEKIKLNSLVKLNGAYYWLRGKTGAQIVLCNANQLVLDEMSATYLKKIVGFFEKQKKLRRDLAPNMEFDKISAEQNLLLFDTLAAKLEAKPYINIPPIAGQVELLKQKRDDFVGLGEKEQMTLIMEILHFLQCNSVQSNLSLIGGAPHAGVLLHSKKILGDEEALLITQSPTGFYQEIVDLTEYYKQ